MRKVVIDYYIWTVMETGEEIIIVPDVHGRTFWRAAKRYVKTHAVVFLGDYLDPYPDEGIGREEAYDNFKEILQFKKENKDNVHLLLGNHDLGYLDPEICSCRRDYERAAVIRATILREWKNFDMGYVCECDGKVIVCSHAGIHPCWDDGHSPAESVVYWNGIFHNIVDEDTLIQDEEYKRLFVEKMQEVSWYRGGFNEAGSMVWADVREFKGCPVSEGIVQIVGHSQQWRIPLWVNDSFVCTDCRTVFCYNIGLDDLVAV